MPIERRKDGVILRVKVQPKAKKEGIAGIEGDRLKLKVNAPPERARLMPLVLSCWPRHLG